jgi:NAD+ synthase
MENFNAKEVKNKLVQGIRDWFEKNGKDCKACIGLSGGKDSTIVAALCAEALGKENVIGVAIPGKGQGMNDADEIAKYLGVEFLVVNIGAVITLLCDELHYSGNGDLTEQAEQNIPPRVRMLIMYAISQSNNGRVIGTCNASENYIGYFTKYGDGASDFEPIAELTVHELYQIGDELGIPKKWTYKIPDDGLPHSLPDDEKFEKMGFNYEKLDKYIRTGTSGDELADKAIKRMHDNNLFKMKLSDTIKI